MIGYAIGTGGSEPPKWSNFSFERRKQSTYAYVADDGSVLFIDAGTNPLEYIHVNAPVLFITHWHSDHFAGLYSMRWENGIRVYAPADDFPHEKMECKHFARVPTFQNIKIGRFTLTPLPLNHTVPTFGYYIENGKTRIAHLLDTRGIPQDTLDFLYEEEPDKIVIDAAFLSFKCCNENWGIDKGGKNTHNGTKEIEKIAKDFSNMQVFLTHFPPYAPPSWITIKYFHDKGLKNVRVLVDGMIY